MNDPEMIELDDVVVLRCELLAEGYTDAHIRAKLRSGELHRVRHGSYVSGDLWARLSDADRHRVLIRAVLKRAHPSTVVTHISAAVERGAPVWGIPLDTVHTTRADGKSGRREAGVAQHRGQLPSEHITEVNGIRVSVAPRCAVEVTSMTTVEPALITVNGMLHAGWLTVDEFAAMADELRYWPETLTTGLVLRLCEPLVESIGESRTDYLCWTHHLPRPTPQVKVFDEHGRLLGRVDFAWPELRVFLEFHGREKYELFRRPNETLEEYLMREKTREEQICQVTGWTCIRITWADLENPVRTARRIRRILESRRPVGA